MLITGPGDAPVDATLARSHGYPGLLDMRRAVWEQVQPAEPGDDHTPTRPVTPVRRGAPTTAVNRAFGLPPPSPVGPPEAACRQGEDGIEAARGAVGSEAALLRVPISLLDARRRARVGGLFYSVHRRSR